MGLKEKKLRKVIEDENIPFHARTFKDYCGGELEVDIDWDEWMSDYEGLLNLNGYQIQQFTDSLNLLGHDADTKEAVAESIRTVKIERADAPEDRSIELSAGVLSIRTSPSAGWEGAFNGREIADYLLDNL